MLEVDIEGRAGGFRLNARFAVDSAGITALFGRSGAGKTTLIDMIAGLRRPVRGRIVVNDGALFDSARKVDVPPHKRRVGYVFQDARLFPHLSVRANLVYGAKPAQAGNGLIDVDRIIDLLGLGGLLSRRPSGLSGGERQRVALGRALLSNPQLLLMDEPLAALDMARREEILPFIENLHREVKIPIVYVSHALEEILRIADSMVLLADGQVTGVGPVEDIASRHALPGWTGHAEPDTVISAVVDRHDPDFDLTYLVFGGHRFIVPRVDVPIGARLRVRVLARDVSLALTAPTDVSILNTFSGTIEAITSSDRGTALVALTLDGGQPLMARVTHRACHDLGLAVGGTVHALVKGVAVGRYGPGQWDDAGTTAG